MPVILTSNGLSSDSIVREFALVLGEGGRRAAVVVTADPVYREKNRNAVLARERFETIGFQTDFIDIEFSSPNRLVEYDVVYLSGGNPFYLLHQIRKTGAADVMRECLAIGQTLAGASAGSIVLGETAELIMEFDPQLNQEVGLTDFTGVGLTDIAICPHYSRYTPLYENFEARIASFERAKHLRITRLDDGEAIVVRGGQAVKIGIPCCH